MKTHDVRAIYKLPNEIKFCKKCVISNQRPRIKFDKDGVCSACKFSNYKNNGIDWVARENELKLLCDKHRSKTGEYDVVVPGSGGKDSNYVAHMLKERYGMTPLTVTWAPHIYTEIGRKNLTNFIDSGFDNLLFTPRGDVHRILTKASFLEMGDPFQPFIFGQYTAPFRVALQYNIQLVFYGEDGEVEYGGSMEHSDRSGLDFSDFVKNRFSGIYPDYFKNYGLSENDLKRYSLQPNEIDALKKLDVQQKFFSYYHKWVPQENFYYATDHTNFSVDDARSEGTYTKFASLDDKLDGFHFYLAFIKFGLGRCTSDAAHEVRDGYISREEAVSLVNRFDGEFPQRHFSTFLDYCGISESEFTETIDSWRSDHLWRKNGDNWELKRKVE